MSTEYLKMVACWHNNTNTFLRELILKAYLVVFLILFWQCINVWQLTSLTLPLQLKINPNESRYIFLISRLPLKCEVGECLRSHANSFWAHKSRVWVVLDILALNEMLKMEEGASFPVNHFYDGHLKYVHLQKRKYTSHYYVYFTLLCMCECWVCVWVCGDQTWAEYVYTIFLL